MGVLVPAAWAVDDTQTGATGATGQAGSNATATAVSGDPSNTATANGGTGGATDSTRPRGRWFGHCHRADHGRGRRRRDGERHRPRRQCGLDPERPLFQQRRVRQCFGPTMNVTATAIAGLAAGTFSNGLVVGQGAPAGTATAAATGTLTGPGLLTITVLAQGGSGGGALGPGPSPFPPGPGYAGAPGGAASFGTIFGSSGGDATISATAIGGAGGNCSYPATPVPLAGDGASITLNNAVDGVAAGHLTLVQNATGGAGGVPVGRGFAGNGGNASSTLDRTTSSPTQVLEVRTSSTGGNGDVGGSGGFGSSAVGSLAGTATAVSRARNDFGGAVATSTALGGSPYSGSVAVRASGGSANATSAATAGGVGAGRGATASATATGPAGHNNPSLSMVAGGDGAPATAAATATSSNAAPAGATATATAGNGGLGVAFSISAPGSNGGTATATAMGSVGGITSLTLNANASGGNAPGPSYGNGGSATAQSSGTTGGAASIAATARGGLSGAEGLAVGLSGNASATASGTAASGTLRADAQTGRGGSTTFIENRIATISAVATAPLGGSAATALAQARLGVAAPSTSGLFSRQSTAFGIGAPLATDVNTVFSGNPKATARFDPTIAAQSLVLGVVAAGSSATTGLTLNSTISTSINLSAIQSTDQKVLQLALLNPQTQGLGFDTLRFRVTREGAVVIDQSFVSLSSAQAYFSDQVLNLGVIGAGVTGTLDLTISLDVVTSRAGDGFGATFFLGNAAIPEPSVFALLAVAGLACLLRRRSARREPPLAGPSTSCR